MADSAFYLKPLAVHLTTGDPIMKNASHILSNSCLIAQMTPDRLGFNGKVF